MPSDRSFRLSQEDAVFTSAAARFSAGRRPLIRWIKGDGLDDPVTRAAIAQATRLFGSAVDYCLCTDGIDAARARDILAWAERPVEWRPVGASDNPELADLLIKAGCEPAHFGYWWKWFPERVRPDAPEIILDGDMVITGRPYWWQAWQDGRDRLRVSEDNREDPQRIYGRYADAVDTRSQLYSGLIALPPNLRYMPQVLEVLTERPLQIGHDGRRDMCEQGVVAAAFQRLNAFPVPLYQFPFGRAFETSLDYGLEGDLGRAWGFHFGNAFRRANPHFERLCDTGEVFDKFEPTSFQRNRWLGGTDQWGVPGWSSSEEISATILQLSRPFINGSILEVGTSRGRMTAILADAGLRITTLDREDRGAAANLAGLAVTVVQDELVRYLSRSQNSFDLIVVDIHGNTVRDWKGYSDVLIGALARGGMMLISNANLNLVSGWQEETGVSWFLGQLPTGWTSTVIDPPVPGIAVVRRP